MESQKHSLIMTYDYHNANLDKDTYNTMLNQVDAKGLFIGGNFDFKFNNIDVMDIAKDIDSSFEKEFLENKQKLDEYLKLASKHE